MFAITTRGQRRHDEPRYRNDDVFVFGPETRGLPDGILAEFSAARRIRVPMQEPSRSLNLSNAVSIVVYEALRQLRGKGAAG